MTSDLELAPAASAARRVGQTTAIEQSRAVAEVQAAVVIAQQCPRDPQSALATMRESCRIKRLAERAFYRYKRGGEQITGPTVHLARELARIWGNIAYGISELERDDEHGQSTMQAWAWDLQTNVRPTQAFIVPHRRDTKEGVKFLVDLRDIYENNTNHAARRLRQQIWAVLPPWYVEEAEDLCAQTLRDGGGKPLPQRISDAIELFAVGPKVRVDLLERKVGRPRGAWDAYDLAQLTVIYRSLQRGEVRVEDEFGEEPVTAAEIAQQAAPEQQSDGESADAGSADPDVEDPPVRQDWPDVAQPGQGTPGGES